MRRWRVGLKWYAAALLLPAAVAVTAAAINVFVLGAETSTSSAELGGWTSLVPTFFILLMSPAWAALGRSPGSAAMPYRSSARSISARCEPSPGVFWAVWHLPLFITGEDHWNEIVQIVAWTVVFAWLMNNTGQEACCWP